MPPLVDPAEQDFAGTHHPIRRSLCIARRHHQQTPARNVTSGALSKEGAILNEGTRLNIAETLVG